MKGDPQRAVSRESSGCLKSENVAFFTPLDDKGGDSLAYVKSFLHIVSMQAHRDYMHGEAARTFTVVNGRRTLPSVRGTAAVLRGPVRKASKRERIS